MASIAGNKRHRNEHTLDVKYTALMKIDRGNSNKDVLKKIQCPKKHHVYVKKEQGENNRCIQE